MLDLQVNGGRYEVDTPVGRTLAETLREDIGLTGTKVACGEGHCGACTVRLDGVPVLSCITLVHTVEGREVTTIEGLRDHPLVAAFVRADALQCGFCTPGQIVSASALVEAVPEPTRDEIRHAMGGNLCRCGAYPKIEEAIARMARLIRTEKEVEGHYSETWVVVEEDALDQWPAGALNTVGRDAARIDGTERARGEAMYTADLVFPGMLHAAILRSPHSRARVASIDLAPALAAPGVRAALGPEDLDSLTDEPGFVGAAVAAVAADTDAQARAAVEAIAVEWEVLEPLVDPDEAVERKEFLSEPRRYERGDYERGLAEADVVVEAEYRTQVALHNSMEPHGAVCRWEGETLEVYISTQFIWGVRSTWPSSSDWRRTTCAWSATSWAAASARRTAPVSTPTSRPSSRGGRARRCAASTARREENLDAATATGRSSASSQAPAPTAR